MPAKANHDEVSLRPGEVIDGKYEILSKIGQGRMGVVYRAHAIALNREAAIKMLTHVDEHTIAGFHREAATMGQINHRAVVRVDDFGDAGKWGPYLAMAYVPGRDLATFAKRQPISIQEAVDIALAICSGVSACHLQSIVHRDLKPSNVRVTDQRDWQDRVKILDFGLALPFESPRLKPHQTLLTRLDDADEGAHYVPPELLQRQPATRQCDQYGIAALLYLLLSGRAPFHELRGDRLQRAILDGEYVGLHLVRPETPRALRAAITCGLQVDPSRRFPTVDDFALALLPEASPHLKSVWTRYFSNAKGPINRRLIEPVSAYRPAPDRHPPRQGGTPVAALAGVVPASTLPEPAAAAVTAEAPADGLSASTISLEVVPSGERAARNSRDLHTVFVLLCGIAVGAAVTVGAFICFLLYQRQANPCLPPAPATELSTAKETPGGP